MTATLEFEVEDRWTAIKVLRAAGKTFAEIVPMLHAIGLLGCQKEHRKRRGIVDLDGSAVEVCATCENTIAVEWKRNLHRLSEDDANITEARWQWMRAHELIERLCIENAIVERVVTTTDTRIVDGKEVQTVKTTTERRVNIAAGRLWSDVRDKMARMSGLDLDNPIPDRPPERRKLNVYQRTADNDERPN